MSGLAYIPKTGKIYVVTLTVAGTWYTILTEAQAKALRGIRIKSRYTYGQTAQTPFDLAFSATPSTGGNVTDGTGILTYSGSGISDTLSPSSGVWARSAVAGTIIEVETFE